MAAKPTAALTPGIPGREKGKQDLTVPCQICGAATVAGLDLGGQPIADYVLTEAELNQPLTLYPLRLQHCPDCGLTQLSYLAPPEEVYKGFPFVSGTTATATRHLQTLPGELVDMAGLDENSFALDIGSNDGTLLKAYIPFHVRFLGVDPAGDPVRIANEQGLTTLHAFFDPSTAEYILKEYGLCDAITACGVFGHIADVNGIMQGIKMLLAPRGIFASDNQYWLDTKLKGHYDNMFHQHLRYYSLKPLIHLFDQFDMDVIDVTRSEIHGGSIRVFTAHRGAYPISDRVQALLELENQAGLYDMETNSAFAREIETRRQKLFEAVYERKKAGKKIIGIGAPAKASTVCNYCRLGPDLIDYITEINPLRMGMYLPGVNIPIVDEEVMFSDERPADAAVLFAWNYHDEIVPKLRARGFLGEILLP